MSEQLTALDNAFLELETENAHNMVGSLAIFEGGALDKMTFEELHARLIQLIEARIHRVPRFRQRIVRAPFDIVPPEWVDDPGFDIEYHVRRTALPSPGRESQLFAYLGHIMSRPLDRAKPLWEIYLVEGLEGGRGAVVQKTHHALVDGISAVDIGTVLLDFTPDAPVGTPEKWAPSPGRPLAERVLSRTFQLITSPRRALNAIRGALQSPEDLAAAIQERATGIGSVLRTKGGIVAPECVLNQQIGPHRKFAGARTMLEDFKRIKNVLGGTVNDVVLAATTGGLRHFLIERGELIDPDAFLRAMVPVSVRTDDEHLTLGNRVSAMFATLPIGLADPVEVLEAIKSETADLKQSHQALGAEFLIEMSGFAPATLHALGARMMGRGRLFNLTISNVPGPQFQLYLLGSRLVEAFPVVPLAEGGGLSVGATSYNGGIYFGLNADPDIAPDVGIIAEGIEKSVAELRAAAG